MAEILSQRSLVSRTEARFKNVLEEFELIWPVWSIVHQKTAALDKGTERRCESNCDRARTEIANVDEQTRPLWQFCLLRTD